MKGIHGSIALALALVCSGCILGGEYISSAEAQRIDREQCERKPDAEARRVCLAFVAKRYHKYNSMGGYPDNSTIPGPQR